MDDSPSTALWAGLAHRFKREGWRLLEGLERRRAEALRRKPARLVRTLRQARNVLVLCQGNVIRSVFAARVLRASLAGSRPASITSAGLLGESGWRAHPRVVARCADLGIDLRGHASTPVTSAMVKTADVVLVMEVSQLAVVTRRFPRARRRTFLLTSLAPEVPMEIADPAGKDRAVVDACLDQIAQALKPMIGIFTEREIATP